LGARDRATYRYAYHSLNALHGFRYFPARRFEQVLGIGSAYGDEFLPILTRIGRITILDPSEAFLVSDIGGVPCRYVKPTPHGKMPFSDSTFDLITCLGVFHHIPNVRAVMQEVRRCVAPGGIVLVREPIRSMGDWTKTRPGLTKRERGIPLRILIEIATGAGFVVRSRSLCLFPPMMAVCSRLRILPYNNAALTRLDAMLCSFFRWNDRYHPGAIRRRSSPAAAYLVLECPASV